MTNTTTPATPDGLASELERKLREVDTILGRIPREADSPLYEAQNRLADAIRLVLRSPMPVTAEGVDFESGVRALHKARRVYCPGPDWEEIDWVTQERWRKSLRAALNALTPDATNDAEIERLREAFDELIHRADCITSADHLPVLFAAVEAAKDARTTKADAAGEGVEAPNVYQIGNAMFVGIRAFLNSAAIDASKCKVVIEMPDRDTALRLVGAVRHDAWPAPPNSAARHGNYSGFWQGVEYEFSVKGWSDSRTPSQANDAAGQELPDAH